MTRNSTRSCDCHFHYRTCPPVIPETSSTPIYFNEDASPYGDWSEDGDRSFTELLESSIDNVNIGEVNASEQSEVLVTDLNLNSTFTVEHESQPNVVVPDLDNEVADDADTAETFANTLVRG